MTHIVWGDQQADETDDVPVEVFLQTEFYELFGVDKNARYAAIRKSWRALVLRHHPDKGGHPLKFAYIDIVHKILKNPASRAEYDSNGRAPFEEQLPKQTTAEPNQPGAGQRPYDLLVELVNITMLKNCLLYTSPSPRD